MEAEDLEETEELLKPSVKRPRTPAQIAAFEKARAKRIENAKLKQDAIADVKEKVKTRKNGENPFVESSKPAPVKKPVVKKQVVEESSESEEENITVVEAPPKKKRRE